MAEAIKTKLANEITEAIKNIIPSARGVAARFEESLFEVIALYKIVNPKKG
jgi:hypothetical protein